MLKVTRTSDIPAILDDDEKAQIDPSVLNQHTQPGTVTIINEAGLYSLILRSRKPEATVKQS